MPHPFKTLAEANEAFAALTAEQTANTEALAAAQGQAQKNFSDLTAALAECEIVKTGATAVALERDELRTQLSTVTTEMTALRDGEAARTGAAIQSALAGIGLPEPVAQPVDTGSTAVPSAPAPQKLTGLAAATAAIKAQISRKE